MHSLWHPPGSVEEELGKQQLQLWLCLMPQVCHSCSPLALLSPVSAEELFGQRLLLTTVIQWCGNGDLGSGSSPGYLSAC